MLVTAQLGSSAVGGREQLSTLNRDALREIYGDRFAVFELPKRPLKGIKALWGALRGHIDGLDHAVISEVVTAIRDGGVGCVVLDGSNLGVLAASIKHDCPRVEVITFLHNCEARFFLGALRQRPSVRASGVLLANYLAERCGVRFSDKLICLNERDSRLILRLYGRAATHISPMAMHDQLPPGAFAISMPPEERYALFVGGTFYANLQGIEWFVECVASQAPIKTYVVGKGFERWKTRLERNGNVHVVGAVGSMAPWYLGAQVVIAPIFDGSGMKTKVAEALMFGKRVVGTPEAFVGYEADVSDIGAICVNPTEFLVALEKEAKAKPSCIDVRLRRIYEAHYSYDAAKARLASIIDDLDIPTEVQPS